MKIKQWLNLFVAAFVALLATSGFTFGQKVQKVKVGDPAPDFAVPALEGQRTVRLSDFRGRRVLIFSWASW